MTYKDRLSFTGSATEAEWKPIQRAIRSVPSMETGMQDVEVNETEPNGVLFVMCLQSSADRTGVFHHTWIPRTTTSHFVDESC